MNKRILLLFCLLTPTAHARIRGRMTVETLATERAACSAWDLDATSDTNMSHRCRPANKQSPAPNPGSAKSFTDTITVGNLGTRVYAGQKSAADVSVQVNSCIASVIAMGGGICDATNFGGVQTISQQINVGNTSSVPVVLLMSPIANWGVKITDGTSCGVMVYNNGSIISSGTATGQEATIGSASSSTNVRGLLCTNDSLGGASNTFKVEGIQFNNVNGGTMTDAAVVLRGCKDNSIFRNNLVNNPFSVGLHIGGITANAQCTVLTVEDTWVSGANGNTSNTTAQPVLIQGSAAAGAVSSIRWVSGSIVAPGGGQNSIVIDGGAGINYYAEDITFFGVHMEATINPADSGTPVVRISHAGPVNWYGGAILHSYANGAYCFRLENSATNFVASGVECGHTTMVQNATTGINYIDIGDTTIQYYTESVNNFFAALALSENTAPFTAGTGLDSCYGDSTEHALKCSYNNGPFQPVTLNVQNSALRQEQYVADQGIACTNDELALSTSWGTTSKVTGVVGTGQTCEWTITAGGAGIGASPTITDTLTNPLPSPSTVCDMLMVGGTGTATLIDQIALSATAPVFSFSGTPLAGSTYKILRRCGP
jgi:hypothetical protein